MYEKEFIQTTELQEEQVDHYVEELNFFTAVDESMPSPEEVQVEETIILPEIQSMPAYIRQHFEDEIIRECAQKIVGGELIAVYKGKRFQNTSRHESLDCEEEIALTDEDFPDEWGEPQNNHSVGGVFAADIRPSKGTITWMSFRRVAECCVEADLTIEMKLHFRYGSRGGFKPNHATLLCRSVVGHGGRDQRGTRELPSQPSR